MARLTDKFEVWGHRGDPAHAPENTLESFRLAADLNLKGIELDVHMTKDDQVVVLHDAAINRTSNGQGNVADYTYEELLAFDFSNHIPGFKHVRIPTLDQVFELLKPTDLIINIELKAPRAAMAQECARIAARHGMRDRTMYLAFSHFLLTKVREIDPAAKIGPAYLHHMIKPWIYCKDILGAQFLHPSLEQIRLQPGFIDECHARGILVYPVADDRNLITYFYDAGADGIFSNDPAYAKKVVESLENAR